MPGPAAVWIARRLPVDDARREEVAGSVADLVAARPRCERAREAASLAGLWLQLWGRREGLDDARRAARQGIYLGGVLLAMAASASAGSTVAAILMSVGAALAAGGWRGGAAAAAAAAAIATALATGTPAAVPVLATSALLLGDPFGARRCWRGLAVGAVIAGLLGVVAASFDEVADNGLPAALAVSAAALLAVGRFEPRFAVAATTAWLGVVVATASPTALLLGLAVLVLSGHVSRSALRRSFSV